MDASVMHAVCDFALHVKTKRLHFSYVAWEEEIESVLCELETAGSTNKT